MLNWSNAQETYEVLKKLEFIVVADMFMTPTAAMADIVLPVSSYMEYDFIGMSPSLRVAQIQQKVAEVGECWPDHRILNEISKRLGLSDYVWQDERQFLNSVLKQTHVTFSELKQIAAMPMYQKYRSYQDNGFATPSGKVELYSNQLENWGFDPLPIYREPPETPFSDPELAKEYPLIFTSGKAAMYRHSSGRQIASLRKRRPEPLIDVHPRTARQLNINDGDWAYIETKRGKIKQKAHVTTDVAPNVVRADYGWWYPERGASQLYGWKESNINILTDNKPPYSQEFGSTNLRGIACKVYKAE